jgi:carboxypeptidase PM20D1
VAGPTLVYAGPGSDPTLPPILLMAHQDVVPADEASGRRWARPAFSGALVDGAVWGRGALDDKGALVGIMEAVESLARRGFRPRRGVLLVFGHDEEAGGTGAAAAARLLRERGIRPEFALDEGGLALTADPLTGRPVALIAVAEKGYATLRVTAHGAGGHSSQPPRQTATLVLARAVDRIASRPFPLRFDGPGADTARALAAGAPPGPRVLIANSWLFGPLLAAKLGESRAGAALLHTTIAPTVLQGSPKENVLPETVTALINYRLHPRDSRATALARARAAVRGLPVELEWEPVGAEASPVSATTSRGWRLVAALARQETGARPVPGLSPGATDGRSMSGVARDVYRFLPVLITSEDLETMHGVNERLSVENLHRMCQFYQRLIVAAAG